jgi:hypothetical protein
MDAGLLPGDEKLIGRMIEGICFGNADDYFRFPGSNA